MKYLKCYEMELPKFFLKIYQTYTQNSMCIYNIQFKKKKKQLVIYNFCHVAFSNFLLGFKTTFFFNDLKVFFKNY